MTLNVIFYVLPIITSILVFITKKALVKPQNGEIHAKREMILDVVKVTSITTIALVANYICGKNIPIALLSIDIFMLIVYLLPLVQKRYDYIERQAVIGVLAGVVIPAIFTITVFEMLIGTYDINDPTLLFCFLKAVYYLTMSIWRCSTADSSFFSDIKKSLTKELSKTQYFGLFFISLFIFMGYNNYFPQVCLFGIHDFLNKKKIKGILYIILGNICLFIQHKYPVVGVIPETLYLLLVFIDLLLQFKKGRNK